MSAPKFKPTHRIILNSGERIEVMLREGVGYQRCEWETETQADYERNRDKEWFFQGRPFKGEVKKIKRRNS